MTPETNLSLQPSGQAAEGACEAQVWHPSVGLRELRVCRHQARSTVTIRWREKRRAVRLCLIHLRVHNRYVRKHR